MVREEMKRRIVAHLREVCFVAVSSAGNKYKKTNLYLNLQPRTNICALNPLRPALLMLAKKRHHGLDSRTAHCEFTTHRPATKRTEVQWPRSRTFGGFGWKWTYDHHQDAGGRGRQLCAQCACIETRIGQQQRQ